MAEEVTTTQVETDTKVTSNEIEVPATGAGTDSTAVAEARAKAAELRATQAEMRARQLENERTEAERKKQEEAGEYKELYQKTQQELADLTKQREMDALMGEYPAEVQAVAKKLFGAGDLTSQMAALQEAIKTVEAKTEVTEEVKQPAVTPMNPNPGAAVQSILKPEMTLDEKADALEKRLKGQGL